MVPIYSSLKGRSFRLQVGFRVPRPDNLNGKTLTEDLLPKCPCKKKHSERKMSANGKAK